MNLSSKNCIENKTNEKKNSKSRIIFKYPLFMMFQIIIVIKRTYSKTKQFSSEKKIKSGAQPTHKEQRKNTIIFSHINQCQWGLKKLEIKYIYNVQFISNKYESILWDEIFQRC